MDFLDKDLLLFCYTQVHSNVSVSRHSQLGRLCFVKFIKVACKDTLYVSQDPKVTRNSDSKLEKLSSKRIRDSCLDIEKYIRMNLFKENNLDENALSRLKSKLRKRTEDIVTKQSPVESFDVVSSHLTEAVAEMKKLTDEVDILKDAQLFKFMRKFLTLKYVNDIFRLSQFFVEIIEFEFEVAYKGIVRNYVLVYSYIDVNVLI
ncbi:hypothetical protein GQR58_012651 [Nymphon striatum]|nr:hypothetical protein GQR58_012651 [Nymphon striatum]